MSIINYISDERKQASMDFIQWFAQEDIQLQWAALGGYTCNTNVLASDTFLNATPFNPAFAETMGIVKDFWNVPVYDPLLQAANRNFGAFVIEGTGTAQETMDNVAAEHTQILQDAGMLP
jgi:multiple sugar transport system substrate-binding protein